MGIAKWAAAALAACVVTVPAAAAEQGSPEALGEVFCELTRRDVGKGLLYIFVPPFAQLVDDALARSDEIGAANPDEKPPLGDGIPFQSFPDLAPVCEVGAVKDGPRSKYVDIHHKFPDATGADWTDRLVLVRWNGGAWMIDDILYGAQDYKLGLREVVEDVLKQNP